MEVKRWELMPHVYLTYLPARKFKTGVLSAQFITPLAKETASYNALLPAVLHRGTMRCPDMEQLAAAMDRLYGAQISPTIRKRGETQCLGFVASFIDDRFVSRNEPLLEPAAELLGELLLDPVTRGGRFLQEYVEGEKANLADAIRSIRNDKRDWADLRLLQEMCAGEPYGISRFGDEAGLAKINNQKLYAHSQRMMSSSRLELFYCGSAECHRVEEALLTAFSSLTRGPQTEPEPPRRFAAPSQPRLVTEEMDVTQGKLSMGFRCDTDDEPAMILANLMFGGSSNSKLFLNVREKLSLCYYASSTYVRSKGILTVSSGIETADYDRAEAEILRQLQKRQSLPQRTAEGIKHPHGNPVPALLSNHPGQIIGAGKAAGEHHGNHAVIAFRHNLPQGLSKILRGRKRGLRQLSRPQTAVNPLSVNIHAIPVLPIGAENPQRNHMDVILADQRRRQIRTRVRQQCNFLWAHSFLTLPHLHT